MRVAIEPFEAEADPETPDHSALRLMLSYVEAECLRIGATEAARHAALAASLMPSAATPATPHPAAPTRPRSARLH
ncbi:hypothetical protein ACFQY5_15740 [Paeniroseomonas aquatica]|uniref:Uncharacterized protein n=1 Tax=Paeniroseomonas aquatica TaxID=373043 RepID=A0ABT8A4W3_9PROT|nr:hypothetical protein [Paeniroseomonas aquatica]MDN3564789.1 hypothetical protein [Paeniroseomonas aquatica]